MQQLHILFLSIFTTVGNSAVGNLFRGNFMCNVLLSELIWYLLEFMLKHNIDCMSKLFKALGCKYQNYFVIVLINGSKFSLLPFKMFTIIKVISEDYIILFWWQASRSSYNVLVYQMYTFLG